MLQDSVGRRFHYLRLSVTDVCNFRCNYCLPDGYQKKGKNKFLNVEEIGTLVSAFAELGTSKIRITGGEPSLRRDLPEIIARCKQTAGIEKVAMTSNGYKLEKQIDDWHKAGLDALNISVDSLDPRMFSTITGHNKLEDILRGIEKAADLGISVKINAVLMKQFNGSQLPQYLNWVKDKAFTVRFIELMETGDNQDFFKQNHIRGMSIKDQLLSQGWERIIREKHAGPAQEFKHPDYQGKIGLIMPYSKDFCKSCNRLRVSAKGKMHLCLFAAQGNDLRSWLEDNDVEGLKLELQRLVGKKLEAHDLHHGYTGATTDLAMLGG